MTEAEYALIAEPNRNTAAALVRDLGELTNLVCQVVADGHEGHEVMFRKGTPQLLVTALTLSKRDGFSLIRGMRRLEPGRRACVVALSASDGEKHRMEGLRSELGPVEIVAMPYSTEGFRRAMRMLAATTGKTLTPPAGSARPPAPRTPSATSPWPSSLPPSSNRPPAVIVPAHAPAPRFPPPTLAPPPPAVSASEGIELLERACDALPCGVLVFAADDRVVMTNAAFDALFGLRRGDVLHARRSILISRLAYMFADPDAAVALCATPAEGMIPVTGEIALASGATGAGRVLCWTDTPVVVAGTRLHVISCYDVKVWGDPA